jgi:hypothetical protein
MVESADDMRCQPTASESPGKRRRARHRSVYNFCREKFAANVQARGCAYLEAAMAEIDAVARPNDVRPYQELLRRWRRARKLFFNIVTRIETGFSPNAEPLDEAIRYLKGLANWSNAAMRDAPAQAVPKSWRAHVLDEDGRVGNPKAYVFAIIDAWRMALKRRDVFATPGIRYGDPRRELLDGATWQDGLPRAQPLA